MSDVTKVPEVTSEQLLVELHQQVGLDSSLISLYEEITEVTGLYPEANSGSIIAVNYCALGLGESGEVQGKMKKVWRGDKTLGDSREALLDELGDTLWYVTRMAKELGSTLTDLIDRNGTKVLRRKIAGTTRGSGDER